MQPFQYARCVCISAPRKGTAIPSNINIEQTVKAERAIKLYGEMLHSLALSRCRTKEDAEDVCQEVLIALLNRKEPFKNDEHMKAWLIRATLHRSKNTHRYENRHPHTPYDPTLHDKPEQNGAADCWKLHDAVESLPDELKETLRLYYRDGYSTKEIASLKGVGESSIRARLHRARKKIAAALACVITVSALLFGSVVLPMHQIPEAHAIDFATDTSTSLDDLPVKAIQKTGNGEASVTFEANLTWSITGIERVTYNTNAEDTKLYSPGIGNYYILNKGELGSTGDAAPVSNGNATITLNIEVFITTDENASNDKLCDIAKNVLDEKSLIATAYLKNGTSETAECLFAK